MFAAQDKIRHLGGKVVPSILLIPFDEITTAVPNIEKSYMGDLPCKCLARLEGPSNK